MLYSCFVKNLSYFRIWWGTHLGTRYNRYQHFCWLLVSCLCVFSYVSLLKKKINLRTLKLHSYISDIGYLYIMKSRHLITLKGRMFKLYKLKDLKISPSSNGLYIDNFKRWGFWLVTVISQKLNGFLTVHGI